MSLPHAASAAGITRQLTAPLFVLDARHPPRPVRGRPPPAGGERALPCILLLSRSCDAELDAVQALLRRAGLPCMRLDAEEVDASELLIDPLTGQACVHGQWLVPTVTWVRHFAAAAIAGGGGPVGSAFLRESWGAAASQLVAISAAGIGARRPDLLTQLRLATRRQVAVPRTVITTDPGRAARMIAAPRLIVKAAHRHFVEAEPGRLSGVFPTVVTRRELAAHGVPGPPMVVQEYVEHDAELRVYFAEGELACFEIGKAAPTDPWLAPGRITARATTAPAAAACAVRELAAGLSLRFGAFDFLLRGADPVFLEVNPDGDWRWLETRAGVEPVTMAAAILLRRLHRAAAGPGHRGPRSFGLLAFLAG